MTMRLLFLSRNEACCEYQFHSTSKSSLNSCYKVIEVLDGYLHASQTYLAARMSLPVANTDSQLDYQIKAACLRDE